MHHGVRIQDSALVSAAVLSNRYLTNRFLPDKAIDLIDEAASKLRIEIDSLPTEIDVVQRRILQLEIEQVALEKGDRRRLEGAARRARRRARHAQRPGARDEAALGGREAGDRRHPLAEGRAGSARPAARSARPISPLPQRSATGACPSSSGASPRPRSTSTSCSPAIAC